MPKQEQRRAEESTLLQQTHLLHHTLVLVQKSQIHSSTQQDLCTANSDRIPLLRHHLVLERLGHPLHGDGAHSVCGEERLCDSEVERRQRVEGLPPQEARARLLVPLGDVSESAFDLFFRLADRPNELKISSKDIVLRSEIRVRLRI